MWKPCKIVYLGRQSLQIRILMANSIFRHRRTRQTMSRVSVLRQTESLNCSQPPSWPFACWSLDMIGPLSTAPGGFTHVLVAVDKFTKWIEVKPIKKLSSDRAVEFISEILHRFGFPNTIITDLGSNFTSKNSGITARTPALRSSTYLLHTQEPTTKWNASTD